MKLSNCELHPNDDEIGDFFPNVNNIQANKQTNHHSVLYLQEYNDIYTYIKTLKDVFNKFSGVSTTHYCLV